VTNRTVYTDREKLDIVEQVLDAERAGRERYEPCLFRDDELPILKSICSDLRARMAAHSAATPSNKVLNALSFQINSGMKAKAALGYMEVGHHQAIAEALVLHWATVRLALEQHANGGG
jgi:hypothetical protein